MFGFRDQFIYFECSSCGCLQIDDAPKDLARYYPTHYYSFHRPNAIESLLKKQFAAGSFGKPNLVWRAITFVTGTNQAVESLRRVNPSRCAAILDVGCGRGDLLVDLHSLGFTNLTGADPFIEQDLCPAKGISIRKQDLMQLAGEFDVIMFHHSFEHMMDPVDVMRRVAQILKPVGVVIVRIPVAAFAWRHYGVDWVQLDAPRHIFVPSARSMEVLAARVGLRLGDVIYESNAFQFWGSEQYKRDIPLSDKRSHIRSIRKVLFPSEAIRSYRRRAQELNESCEGDCACFYLHHQ